MNCEKEIKNLKKTISELINRIEDLENKNKSSYTSSSVKKIFDNKVYLESNKSKLIIRGNSYSIKDFIKANKGMWNNNDKIWEINNGLSLVNDIIACLKENDIQFENNTKYIKNTSKSQSKLKTKSNETKGYLLEDSDED